MRECGELLILFSFIKLFKLNIKDNVISFISRCYLNFFR